MTTIDAFILIGGRSSRMGEPKHLIEIAGVTMLDQALAVTRRSLPKARIRIVGSGTVEPPHRDLGVVLDVVKDRGAWSGLHAALASSMSEWTFVIACDYPLMSGRVIDRLADLRDENVDAVVPLQSDGRPQPLCAFYRTSKCRDVAESIVGVNGTPPIRMMYEKVRTNFIEFADLGVDPAVFMNVNSHEDLKKARSLFESRKRLVAK